MEQYLQIVKRLQAQEKDPLSKRLWQEEIDRVQSLLNRKGADPKYAEAYQRRATATPPQDVADSGRGLVLQEPPGGVPVEKTRDDEEGWEEMKPQPLNRLIGLRQQIKDHWREFRPRMYRELEKSGQLEKAVEAAYQNTREALAEAVSKGQRYENAWEAVNQEWAFLPESKEASLPFDLRLEEK